MSRPLGRLAALLLAAACTRTQPSPPAQASPSAGRGSASPMAPARSSPPGELALPAPPASCLPDKPSPRAATLAAESSDALARGARERALACAEEAVRVSPRLVSALTARASALAALGRLEEARLAWSRALAVGPDDAEALLGAAELYVRRFGPSRDALETGLEYAVRGARLAMARRDRPLAARLELVAGMAENDLGRSQLALPHLERAVSGLPEDPDAVYERGVALYELCRFDEAERTFERALALAPDDPWSLHQLGLLAERRGDLARAGRLLARARKLAPEEFPSELAIDENQFRDEIVSAVRALPEAERDALRAVPVEIQDLPDAADLLAVDPPLSPSILGLFRGPSEDEACTPADGPRCRTIVFYRKNLLRFVRDRRELSEQVRVTLLHELGHLHGESDEDLRARGLE